MRRTCLHNYCDANLNQYETVDFRKISKDVRIFFKFSNEKYILTDKIISIIRPRKTFSVLDVGCGEGYVVRKLYDQVKNCTALDPNQKMLERLRKNVKNNPKVIFVNKKLQDFETDEEFDITLSSHTLSFFEDKRQAIDRMLDLTKNGGKLILVLHCQASEQLRMLKEINLAIEKREIKHVYAEALRCYLTDKGFEPKLEGIETLASFPSFEALSKLSYFLFRIDYDRLDYQNREFIRIYMEKKRRNNSFEIRTLHGIISVTKNH